MYIYIYVHDSFRTSYGLKVSAGLSSKGVIPTGPSFGTQSLFAMNRFEILVQTLHEQDPWNGRQFRKAMVEGAGCLVAGLTLTSE